VTAPPHAAFAVYVHWPFCRSKCPYCDFNSHVRERVDEPAWRAALLAELDHYAAQTPGRNVTSIFFGGGTPSLMAPATVGAVLDRISARWPIARDVEITLEANPNSAERARFAALREAGVNRLSLGVQALDDASLKFLGRAHDAREARAAIAAAAATFPRYSFDLIYARPGQTLAAWRAELGDAVMLAGDHLSVYQLTIEPGTSFHTLAARGELDVPNEDDAAALYETTQEMLEASGLPAYEVSNHARPGGESRHNLAYWRYDEYIGVGPGAHGRLRHGDAILATRQEKLPETWVARVHSDGHGTAECVTIDAKTGTVEALMMGLRLTEGIESTRFFQRTGVALTAAVAGENLDRLVRHGLVSFDGGRLRATPSGRPVLNSVLRALIGD
jgi:putative oxygen-independent coproporphyrinogen III oxidase